MEYAKRNVDEQDEPGPSVAHYAMEGDAGDDVNDMWTFYKC
jgi:hypothetical protein